MRGEREIAEEEWGGRVKEEDTDTDASTGAQRHTGTREWRDKGKDTDRQTGNALPRVLLQTLTPGLRGAWQTLRAVGRG